MNEKPRETSSIEERKFSPSFLSDFSCPRKGYLRRIRSYSEKVESVHLTFGKAFHEARAVFYLAREMPIEESREKFGPSLSPSAGISRKEWSKLLAVHAFTEAFSECKELDPKGLKTMEGGMVLVYKYCETYENDTDHFTPEMIEVPIYVEMPNDTLLIGVCDAVKKRGPHWTVLDCKTSGRPLTDFYFRTFELHEQTDLYVYAVGQVCGECLSCTIDAVHVPYVKGKTGNFRREGILKTDFQIEEVVNSYVKKTNFIIEGFKLPEEERMAYFYQERSLCSMYGGCRFLSLCTHGLNHPAISVGFQKG